MGGGGLSPLKVALTLAKRSWVVLKKEAERAKESKLIISVSSQSLLQVLP